MKIVVLDGYALNPGDLSWEPIENLGDCTVYERTPDALITKRAKRADILLVNKTPLSSETLKQLPSLKYIGVLATGFNGVDTLDAKSKGIPVSNIPAYGTDSVAQMVFAHILNLTQRVGSHSEAVKSSRWAHCKDFCFWDFPLIELKGLTLGIIGTGRIGRATASLGIAFGMKVIAYDPVPTGTGLTGLEMKSLDEVWTESDFISLHCPLTPETENLINKDTLGKMKDSAFMINTSRGPLIDEIALADALNKGRLAGAGLDVLSAEPPPTDHPLFNAKNCFITPHISWASKSARSRLMDIAVQNIIAFQDGSPVNVVNN